MTTVLLADQNVSRVRFPWDSPLVENYSTACMNWIVFGSVFCMIYPVLSSEEALYYADQRSGKAIQFCP